MSATITVKLLSGLFKNALYSLQLGPLIAFSETSSMEGKLSVVIKEISSMQEMLPIAFKDFSCILLFNFIGSFSLSEEGHDGSGGS